jgi:adenylate cyclase
MTGERVERRLAAVMAGDIAGYSRLMGADEEGTLRDLKELRASFLHLKIAGASASALWMGSVILAHAGDSAKAIDYAERSLRMMPVGREIALPYSGMVLAYSAAGDFAGAVAAAAKAIQANPRFSLNHVLQAAALFRLGRIAEAKAAAARALECEPDFRITRFVRAHSGRADIWEPIGDALRLIGLPE